MFSFRRIRDTSVITSKWVITDKYDNQPIFDCHVYSPFSIGESVTIENSRNISYIYRIAQIYSTSVAIGGFTQLCKIIFDESNNEPQHINAYFKISNDGMPLWHCKGDFGFEQIMDYFCCTIILPNFLEKKICVVKDFSTNLYIFKELPLNNCFYSNKVINIVMDDFLFKEEVFIVYKKWFQNIVSSGPKIFMIKDKENIEVAIATPIIAEVSSSLCENESIVSEDQSIVSEDQSIESNDQIIVAEAQSIVSEAQLIESEAQSIVSEAKEVISFNMNDLIDEIVEKVISVIQISKKEEESFKLPKRIVEEEFKFPKKHAKKIDTDTLSKYNQTFTDLQKGDIVKEKVIVQPIVAIAIPKVEKAKSPKKRPKSVSPKNNFDETEAYENLILDLLSEFNNQYDDLFKKSKICKSHINGIYDKYKQLVDEFVIVLKHKNAKDILFNIYNIILEEYPELIVDDIPENKQKKISDEELLNSYGEFTAYFGNALKKFDKDKRKEILYQFATMERDEFKKTLPPNFLKEFYYENPITKTTTFSFFKLRDHLITHVLENNKGNSDLFKGVKSQENGKKMMHIDNQLYSFITAINYQYVSCHVIDDVFHELCILNSNIFKHYILLMQVQLKVFVLKYNPSVNKNIDKFNEGIDKIFDSIKINSFKIILKTRIFIFTLLEGTEYEKYIFLSIHISKYIHCLCYGEDDIRPELNDETSELSQNFQKKVKDKFDELGAYFDMNNVD